MKSRYFKEPTPQNYRPNTNKQVQATGVSLMQWLKWFREAGGWGAYQTKPGWSKPHTHSKPTNLALFRRKIALYRFNQGAHTIAGRLKWEQGVGLSPPSPLTLTTGLMHQTSPDA